MMRSTAPASSVKTPTLFTRAVHVTPTALTSVVKPISRQPRKAAFHVGTAKTWDHGAICCRVTCKARATAAMAMTYEAR